MDDVLIYSDLSNDNIAKSRKIEKLSLKLMRARNSIAFNQTCLNNNLLPKYTRIKLYEPAMQSNTITDEFRKNLVCEEIKNKKAIMLTLLNDLALAWNELESSTNNEELAYIESRIKIKENCENMEQRATMTKKLNKLYNGECFLLEQTYKFINLSTQ